MPLCVFIFGMVWFSFFFFSLLGLEGGIFVCFVVGVVIVDFFSIGPNSVQRRVFFMPGISKLPATSACMLQLLHIIH